MSDNTLANIGNAYKSMYEAKKCNKATEELDPVGQADADIDNDGDVDSSDAYLKKRRKAISKSVKDDEKEEVKESHFAVGDKVKCKDSGMTGTVAKTDEPETGKYYSVKMPNGDVKKYAPDELIKESVELEEANGKMYKWSDINNACMKAGCKPTLIGDILKQLKGKELSESVELEEAFTTAVMIPKKTVEVNAKLRNLISMFIKKRKMKMDVDGDNYHYDSTDRKVMKDFEKELRDMDIKYDMTEAVDQTPASAADKETADDKVKGKGAKDFVAKHKKSDPEIEDDAEEGAESASKAGKVTKQAPKN